MKKILILLISIIIVGKSTHSHPIPLPNLNAEKKALQKTVNNYKNSRYLSYELKKSSSRPVVYQVHQTKKYKNNSYHFTKKRKFTQPSSAKRVQYKKKFVNFSKPKYNYNKKLTQTKTLNEFKNYKKKRVNKKQSNFFANSKPYNNKIKSTSKKENS